MFKCSHPKIIKGRICSCGKCINCRKQRVNDWYIRLLHEALLQGFENCCYLTLTYSDENLPCPEVGGILLKKDYQDFLKRLRIAYKRLGYNTSITYFCAGEYGSEFKRPHYHFILFGINCNFSDLINKCWSKGFICLKPLEKRNFRYVAKYCVKNFNNEKFDLNGEVFPEFVRMSTRKTLGYDYIKSDFNLIFTNYYKDGKYSYRIPRAYKKKIEQDFGIKFLKNKLTLYYNDVKYPNIFTLDNYNFLYQYVHNLFFEDPQVFKLYERTLSELDYNFFAFLQEKCEILPFSKFLQQIQVNSQSERDFFFKIKKDYTEYCKSLNNSQIFGSVSSCHEFFYERMDFIYIIN